MSLLAANRLSEFHAEVERLQRSVLSGPHELERNPYLAHPVKLERYLVEGSYNKILMLESSMPAENYRYFTQILLSTVRYVLSRRLCDYTLPFVALPCHWRVSRANKPLARAWV